jgi:hypothetical protein
VLSGDAKLRLHQRTFRCACGAVHDRDRNAATNLRRIGLDAPCHPLEICNPSRMRIASLQDLDRILIILGDGGFKESEMQHFDVVVVSGDPARALAAAVALNKTPGAIAVMNADQGRSDRADEVPLEGTIMLLQPAEERR